MERDRFRNHALEIIKDETLALAEYPPVVLSINADTQAFPSEISKRCLMLYTNASVPGEPELTRAKSEHPCDPRAARERALPRVPRATHGAAGGRGLGQSRPAAPLLHDIFSEHAAEEAVPTWCAPIRVDEYQGRKYEKVRTELLKLWETNRRLWTIGREEVVLSIDHVHDARSLAKEIPDHLLREGTNAGNVVLRRSELEQFLARRLAPPCGGSGNADPREVESMSRKKGDNLGASPAQWPPSKERLEELVEEAIVDAYDESEQRTGFLTMLENDLALPFETEVLGLPVTVEHLDATDALEIIAICRRGTHRQALPVLDLPLPSPPPKGAEWIEAYRYWARGR